MHFVLYFILAAFCVIFIFWFLFGKKNIFLRVKEVFIEERDYEIHAKEALGSTTTSDDNNNDDNEELRDLQKEKELLNDASISSASFIEGVVQGTSQDIEKEKHSQLDQELKSIMKNVEDVNFQMVFDDITDNMRNSHSAVYNTQGILNKFGSDKGTGHSKKAEEHEQKHSGHSGGRGM